MAVVTVASKRNYNAKRGTKATLIGDPLHLVAKIESGRTLYWIWAYQDKDYAELIDSRVSPQGREDIAANWHRDPNDCVVSGRTQD